MGVYLETVMAEKLETVISRNITNTRMRDFYDIYLTKENPLQLKSVQSFSFFHPKNKSQIP